jgi:hypothetical protein
MKPAAAFLFCALLCPAAELPLGKPLTLDKPLPIGQLAASPERYVGKTVQVRGKVTEVCQMMGCWMQIVDPASGKSVRIKVNDGEIQFPKDAAGRIATAEGKWMKLQLSKEQALARAKHEAEEQGRPFNPAKVGPAVLYQIQGTGAVLETP